MGEVADADDDDCVPCEEGCQKCLSVNPRHCLSCLEDYYQLGSSCHKICPERTFGDKTTMMCMHCDDHCENCDEAQCYLCEKEYYLSGSLCVKDCMEGFYGDSKKECEPCHPDCRTCGGPYYDDCDSCEDGMRLVDGKCIDISKAVTCPAFHFLNSFHECEQCHSTCMLCSGPGEDQCNACKDGTFLVAEKQTCALSCPAGTYGNSTSGHCEDCLPGCVLCQEAHRCLKCRADKAQLYLQNGLCVAECQRGYPSGSECRSCAEGCASCQDSPNNCLSCEKEYLLYKHTCLSHCPENYYVKDDVCEPCPHSCSQCERNGRCSECVKYYFLHDDRCLDDCPKGYFKNVQEKKCKRCDDSCSACNGPDADDCISCSHPSAVRYNGACLFNCPSNTYQDKTECRECDRSCLTCSGPHPSSCLSCRPKMRVHVNGHCELFNRCSSSTFEDKDGKCRSCHSSCLLCSGPGEDQCLSCSPPYYLHNHKCVAVCPDEYYGDVDKRECVKCYVTCATCHGHHSTNCLTCRAGHFKLGDSCVEKCPTSFYGSAANGTCEACDSSCAECSGSGNSHCIGCRDGYFLLEEKGICLHVCPSNYFPKTQDRLCQRCHPSCKTCKSSGMLDCTSCYEGFRKIGGICSSVCLGGQYATSMRSEECVPCDSSCTECKGPGPYNCTSCFALERLTEDGRCLSCCGNDKRKDSSPMPWECCRCHDAPFQDWCLLGVNYDFHSREQVPAGNPALVAIIAIVLMLAVGAVVLLVMHWRPKLPSVPSIKSNGYTKVDKQPSFTTATLRDSIQAEYCDRDDDEEEDEDNEDEIVYMGQDGVVYKKFKYGLLDQEEDDMEMDYDECIYAFK